MEPIRVLFVDDEPGIRLTMPQTLEQHGFSVTAVGTVNEALAEIMSAQFDVLLSDLNIGQPSDGFTVVSAMRRTQPECVTLILTGYPGFETALQAIRSQADDYLIKPISIPTLLSLIEEKLKVRNPVKIAATKRIAEILRENTFEITQRALKEMKSDPLLGTLPVTDEQRVEHTPQVLEELATMLDSEEPNRTQPTTIDAAGLRGAKRYQFGYTSPLLATHVRLLERAIYDVIHEQLLSLNLSYFMFDLKRLNDSLGVQLEHSLKAFLDAEGKVATERKAQLEAANVRLTELERLSVQLAQRAAAGVAYWEIEYKTGKRRRWGDVVGVFGRNELEIETAEQFLSIVHPDDREEVRNALDQAFRSHTEYDAEYRITTPDGTVRWLLGRGQPYYDDTGNPVSMVGVNMNVTARKVSEAALLQSEKLAVTGRLAATIAHEINNPLSTVTDFVYSIAHEPTATPTITSYANLAQEELNRIAQIVSNTLGFHRESGSPTTVNVADLLESALTLYEPQIRRKKIRLEKCYGNGLTVFVQPGELRQVFANLVNNAIDALSEGGCLRIRTKSDGGGVLVVIIDNGTGIPRERRAHLFQPFFTTKGEKGTGLGLWVSRSLVEKNGGRIAVRSFVGSNVHGTVFSVVLPLSMPQMAAA